MRLDRCKGLPKRAGDARLSWNDPVETLFPHRKGDIIHLPLREGAEFYPLHNKEQFLLDSLTGSSVAEGPHFVIFGGTDESPFVSFLDRKALKAFQTGGEEAFYDYLKPEVIHYLEERYGVKAKRQGDIFAFPMVFDPRDLGIKTGGRSKNRNRQHKIVSGFRICGTPHELTGETWGRCSIYGIIGNCKVCLGRPRIAQGILHAADHKPLNLEDCLYLLVRTRGIIDRSEAD